ncbi:MAG: hypothetical protein M1835_003254 [Candelina submexicana]|nr:MAG: hypothetical protein M1835_003254 [Candelina submexicana]
MPPSTRPDPSVQQARPIHSNDQQVDQATIDTSRSSRSPIFSGSFWTARSSMYWSTSSATTFEELDRRRNYEESWYQRMIREIVLQQTRHGGEPLDWSGLGQHIEVAPGKPVPCVKSRHVIAHTNRSLVEEVLCRRVRLVRKSTSVRRDRRTSSEQKLQEALSEVRQLSSLRHSHVVQLIARERFSMLLYPVADSDLASLLEMFENDEPNLSDNMGWTRDPKPIFSTLDHNYYYSPEIVEACEYKRPLVYGTICLLDALRYVHDSCIRHLDIKPQNVLVKRNKNFNPYTAVHASSSAAYHFYLCDFGISKEFSDPNESKSEEPPARTLTYCSPEIFKYEEYGRASDVLSLGCVFLEMWTVALGRRLNDFTDFRCSFKDHTEDTDDQLHPDDVSFQGHLAGVLAWIDMLRVDNDILHDSNKEAATEPIDSLFHQLAWHEPVKCLLPTGERNPRYQQTPVGLIHVRKMLSVNPDERPTLAELERKFYEPWSCCTSINPAFEIEEITKYT